MAEKSQDQPSVDPKDLDLVDDALEDEGKDEAALWAEFDQAEGTAAASDDTDAEPSPGDDPGDGDAKDAAAAAAETDEPGDGAATRDQAADGAPGDGGQPSDGGKPSDKPQDDTTDIWAKAPPEYRAAYEAAQQQWESRDRRLRGQVSGLQRKVDELTTRPADTAAPKGDAGKGDGKGGAETPDYLSSDGWKSFEQEYPEVAGPLGTVIRDLHATIKRQDDQLSVLRGERQEDRLDEQEDLLTEAHPDWEQVTADPAFATWLNDQPDYVRQAARRNDNQIVNAEEAADVLGRFKADRAAQTNQGNGNAQGDGNGAPAGNGQGKEPNRLSDKRQRQLDSAATARTRSSTGVAADIPEDGDPELIWKQFDEQEARQGARA